MFSVAFVGTGAKTPPPGTKGFAMAYRHASGYARLPQCQLVACADIVRENAQAFAEAFGIDGVYTDVSTMLDAANPDIVSIATPPGTHADIVTACARHPSVRAIHCEKPMALTWGDAKRMVAVCDAADVQLTFNHQYRFGEPFRRMKALLDAGEIGTLERIEFADRDLYDTGTHLFDLADYMTDGTPVEWVLAQVEYSVENRWFGTHNENQGLAQWKYDSGVYGLAATGWGADMIGCFLRLVGSEGVIEIRHSTPALFVKTMGDWRAVDTGGEGVYGPPQSGRMGALLSRFGREERTTYVDRAIAHIVECLETDRESELSGKHALAATELIFACWESARRRGRVSLPLGVEDNPLESMVEAGDLRPATDSTHPET
ncbi:Gfo/Idh/MocA family protein [Haladaptatus sp. DYSN1]|uniref:Gfo/Idh/MocA family protein n=1 Tax=unclassified Haladaptatus TaxID=2622732 RepID=UPI0024052984|nr:Gfo/Idh/MocA family oxidoreductase [Haladaptatus sp. DYSN1]